MNEKYVMGLDIGTTSVKTVLFGLDGQVKAEVEQPIETVYPNRGWAEQDPEEIERLAVAAIRDVVEQSNVVKESILAIGISCAMHSLICVAANGKALSNALIWSDSRSSEQADRLLQEGIGQQVFMKTGVPIHPMSPLIKLLWMKEIGFEPYKQASYYMSVKEYLLYQWFGKRIIDYSMASATGLFNPKSLQWEEAALELAGIQVNQLSTIVPPTERLTDLSQTMREKLGLAEHTAIVVGSADGQLANLGIGAILPGEVAITVGTSGAVRQFAQGVHIGKSRETFCYAFTANQTIVGGPTNNGGIALQWLKQVMNNQEPYEQFIAKAEAIPPGAEGMLFIPYINGERAPIWDANATGQFHGLTVTHSQAHFIRAVLEGITFNLYQIERSLRVMTGEPERIYVNGGLARSPLWLQMLADVFGKEVHVAKTHHSSAWGAAWTALVGIGKVNSFAEIKENVQLGESYIPDEIRHRQYQEVYKTYVKLAAL